MICTKFPSRDAKNLLEIILETIKQQLENGEEVKIHGFGKWGIREKKSRPGRNPLTGEVLKIPARKVVTFHSSNHFRDIVKKRCAEKDEKNAVV